MPNEDEPDLDVATITIVRVGGRIRMFSKGDGHLGAFADGMLRTFQNIAEDSGLFETVEAATETRDPYAGTKERPDE